MKDGRSCLEFLLISVGTNKGRRQQLGINVSLDETEG